MGAKIKAPKLSLPQRKLLNGFVRRVIKKIKSSVRKGSSPGGRPLPQDQTGNRRPLHESGALIKSLKAKRKNNTTRVIQPRGVRADGKPNQLIYASLLKKNDDYQIFDMDEDQALKLLDEEIEKQNID